MENLDDELHDISPLLRGLKRQGDGLSTPEGYFDNMEAQVFGRLGALVDHQPWSTNSKVPHQPHNLLGKLIVRQPWLLTSPTVHRSIRLSIRLWPRALTTLAAGLALMGAAVWFFHAASAAHQSPLLAQVTMPDLSEDEIETYVLENVHEFDTEQLAALPSVEADDITPEVTTPKPSPYRSKRQQALDDLRPEDLDNLLDGLSDEDLEKLL